MFKKIPLIIYLICCNVWFAKASNCPQNKLTENAFADSVYQSFYEAKEKTDIIFALNDEGVDDVNFFKKSFRAKILLQKIKEEDFLKSSVISGAIFVQDALGSTDIHLIGTTEMNAIASFSPSPNQIITISFSEKFQTAFFPKENFSDPVIENLQGSKVVEKFPQLLNKEMLLSNIKLKEKMATEIVKKSAEAICFRYQEIPG